MKTSVKHQYVMKLVVLLGLFFIGHSASAQSKISNFSGTWLLNTGKSDFGHLTASSATKIMTVTIKQAGNSISMISGDPEDQTESLVKLDGTPSALIVNKEINGIPNVIKEPLTVQVINNLSFVVRMDDPKVVLTGAPSSSVKIYNISADLQTLTVDAKNNYGNSELTLKLVYERKKGN